MLCSRSDHARGERAIQSFVYTGGAALISLVIAPREVCKVAVAVCMKIDILKVLRSGATQLHVDGHEAFIIHSVNLRHRRLRQEGLW